MIVVLSPRSSIKQSFSYSVLLNCKVSVSLKAKIVRGKGSVKTAVLIFRDRISANINYHRWVETSS